MSIRGVANATDGQQVIARTLLDDAGVDGWVDNSLLLERTGLSCSGLSVSLHRRLEWGWVERRVLPVQGGPVQWRATETGRVRLRDVLIRGGAS